MKDILLVLGIIIECLACIVVVLNEKQDAFTKE